jgi:hypothetical protein
MERVQNAGRAGREKRRDFLSVPRLPPAGKDTCSRLQEWRRGAPLGGRGGERCVVGHDWVPWVADAPPLGHLQ